MIEDAIAKRLRIRRTIGNMEELSELRRQFRGRLYEQYRQAGAIDWEAVDAFPEPPDEAAA